MPEEITVFAETNFRNQYRQFGIKTDDRRRHMYLVGKTGMGKSTILENMIIDDIRSGKGVMVVDPHGDLAEKIIDYIPSGRVNDVIYFNPADIDYPIAFNIVEQVESHLRHLVASGLIGVFKKLWADSWGPRLEYILRNAILAVLDYPGSTLLAVTRMLSDKSFRKKVIEKIQDPVVKSFWVNEFSGYANNFASEAVSPIQNKVGQFLSSALIRNIVGQVKSSIDLREVMDSGKILILNLSKGRIGEDNSALLGAMMITKVQLSVMSRVDILERDRKDFYLYIDEFQNFTTDSFANILSEARKYRLNLIMAHQYIEQLGEIVKPAVFGNVGTLVVFRVGATDAEELVKEFTPVFTEEDLVNLAKYEFYIKLMIDGVSSDPFSARGRAPLTEEEKTGNKEKVIKVSRERYARQRAAVEEKINRWHTNNEEMEERTEKRPPERKIFREAPAQQFMSAKPAPRNFPPAVSDRNTAVRPKAEAENLKQPDANNYICSRCSKPTQVSFVPDGIRPIFCKDCLSLAKKEKKQEMEARHEAKKRELAGLSARVNPEIRENFSSPNNQPAVSLGQAIKHGPVNFQGRKIEPRPGNFKTGDSNKTNQSGAVIKENEDVVLKPF
ncbi:MAG: type IV secretion system DNA-binding domain-containing protein [bacterium]|nr:type IV secretion system DNA-binding domain-containing protein [bacterium]